MSAGFTPPPYPYDRLEEIVAIASAHEGGAVDLSIGTPCDPPPPAVLTALTAGDTARGYPPSIGSPDLRAAAARWIARRLGAHVDPGAELAACVGTKEFVASVPQYLKLRDPMRDTVLYPAISYPTYEMGAILAGLRAVPYLHLDEITEADADRALCVWVNSPANPTGELHDLAAAARWGRDRDVPVISDECYAEFTWTASGPTTILREGTDGVLAVHSLSKRDNFAGARIGFYAGDAELVHYLREVRKHAGLMPPGPVQAAAVVALDDDEHVAQQRERYRRRLSRLVDVLAAVGYPAALPDGAFYLWVDARGDAWGAARSLASKAGLIVSPGDFYGQEGRSHFRVAAVQPDAVIDLAARRVGA